MGGGKEKGKEGGEEGKEGERDRREKGEGGGRSKRREAVTCSLHSTADGSCDIILPHIESELHGHHVPETNT